MNLENEGDSLNMPTKWKSEKERKSPVLLKNATENRL